MPSEHELRPPFPEGVMRLFKSKESLTTCLCVLKNMCIVDSLYDDPSLRVWDIETGEQRMVLEGHTGLVMSVSALNTAEGQGQQIVSGSDDKTLRVWDTNSGECLKVLEGHTGSVKSVCALDAHEGQGQRVVSGSDDKTLRVWDTDSGECLKVLEGHTGIVASICALNTPEGQRIVSGSSDRTMRIWNPVTGECLKVLKGHTRGVTSVCEVDTPAGQRIVSGSYDETIRVWDPTTGICVRVLNGHTLETFEMFSVCALGDGHIVSLSYDKNILRIWNISAENPKVLKIIVPTFKLLIQKERDGNYSEITSHAPVCLAKISPTRFISASQFTLIWDIGNLENFPKPGSSAFSTLKQGVKSMFKPATVYPMPTVASRETSIPKTQAGVTLRTLGQPPVSGERTGGYSKKYYRKSRRNMKYKLKKTRKLRKTRKSKN
jgi:WD40 repeat protein